MSSSVGVLGAAGLSIGPALGEDSRSDSAEAGKRLADAKRMLAQANRILEHEGVLTGPGHVSVRHPTRRDRYLLSRLCSPRTVRAEDILEFNLDSTPIVPNTEANLYSERYIHGQFYARRPEVGAVVHSHAPEVLPFTISDQPLRVVIVDAARLGARVPVWDIRERFGDATDVMVTSNERAKDLVLGMGKSEAALIRGHGFVAVSANLVDVTHLSVKLALNAKIQREAMALGKIKPFTDGEIAILQAKQRGPRLLRFWNDWLERVDLTGL